MKSWLNGEFMTKEKMIEELKAYVDAAGEHPIGALIEVVEGVCHELVCDRVVEEIIQLLKKN